MAQEAERDRPRFEIGDQHEHGTPGSIGRRLRDIILGGQDGLVNVLGLVLGVAAATQSVRVIFVAGLAATFSESIAMGGVAYTSALADRDYYLAQRAKEAREVEEIPDKEREEVRQIFREKGLHGDLLERVVEEITSDRDTWLQVMMSDELHLSPVVTKGLVGRAMLTGVSTLIGSLIPLIPFVFVPLGLLSVGGSARCRPAMVDQPGGIPVRDLLERVGCRAVHDDESGKVASAGVVACPHADVLLLDDM